MTCRRAVARPTIREEFHRVAVGQQKLALALHLPSRTPAPCVVACHGLGASKDSEKYLLLGREFPQAGLALCRFDFRGCGESDGTYAESTVAGRIADLEAGLQRSASEDVAGLGRAFFEELATGALADTPAGVACSLTIQADGDEVVPPGQGQILFDLAAEPKELCFLEGADHRLSDMAHRMQAVTLSLRWLARYLS